MSVLAQKCRIFSCFMAQWEGTSQVQMMFQEQIMACMLPNIHIDRSGSRKKGQRQGNGGSSICCQLNFHFIHRRKWQKAAFLSLLLTPHSPALRKRIAPSHPIHRNKHKGLLVQLRKEGPLTNGSGRYLHLSSRQLACPACEPVCQSEPDDLPLWFLTRHGFHCKAPARNPVKNSLGRNGDRRNIVAYTTRNSFLRETKPRKILYSKSFCTRDTLCAPSICFHRYFLQFGWFPCYTYITSVLFFIG
jgi:hypothetical protein